MEKNQKLSCCSQCRFNRRNFLMTSLAGVGAAGMLVNPGLVSAEETKTPIKIRIIYSLHDVVQPGPDWPNVGFDFAPVMKKIEAELPNLCPGFTFVTSLAKGEEEAKAILEKDKDAGIDGYLVYQLNCWNKVVQTIATSNKPVLYADFQFGGSGGFLVYTAGFLRTNTANVGFVASSKMEDVAAAVRCFEMIKRGGSANDFAAAVKQVRTGRTPKCGDMACTKDSYKALATDDCAKKLKESKILAVQDQNSGAAGEMFGVPVEKVSFAEVNAAWEKADKDQCKEVAGRWKKNAAAVDGVSEETLLTSAAMYLGMKDVLKKHNANAITMNCLGGFYGGHIHAYPCLGFHELCNESLVGACEADVASTACMIAVNTITQGRPGYISDPVIDTSKRQIIYAHCVAPNKMFGPEGPTNPYTIMTHSEDRKGASIRSTLPTGYMTTSIRVNQERKEVLFHQAKAISNDPDDRACRTKLCAEPVGDIEKLFTQWDQWSWHRVTVYGDLKKPIFALADKMGWKVVEEA